MARRVCARCGCQAWFDEAMFEMDFGFQDGSGGATIAHAEKLRNPDRTWRDVGGMDHQISEDAVALVVNLTRVSAREKARWARIHEARRESDARNESAIGEQQDEARRWARDHLATKARVSAVVN